MSKINTKIIKKKKLNTADNLEKHISGRFRCSQNRTTSVPLLYRLVYSSRISFITVFILLLSFVFQNASLTYAEETPESDITMEASAPVFDESEVAGEFEIQEKDDFSVNVLIEEQIVAGVINDVTSDTSSPLDKSLISEDQTSGGETGLESLSNNDGFTVTLAENDSSTSTTEILEPNLDDQEEIVSEENNFLSDTNAGDSSPEELASTTEIITNEISHATATTTNDLLEEAVTITKSDTEYTFNRNECTTLASGSFYCLKADPQVLEDALFSAPDIDGDLEIYLVRNGIRFQVTNNQVDDAAPYYDQNSDTIVWHRLIDDRYQIIDYDISSGIETQLTFGETNSMEPTRQGKYTVWQNWSNNNWNVVLFDGKEQRTITESNAHDIAPYVHGSLVVWNRYSTSQDKTIEMYDMISETYVTVDDPEGLSVTNPRMVFVYDSLHPNGDVVTKGYDMISRKFIQLDTLPRQLPDEIPQSESTGETRALIQSKPSVKSDEAVQNNNATSTGPTPPELSPATTSDPMTLDLTTATSSPVDVLPVLDVPVMAEYELIIPPLQTATETVQE